MSLDRRRVAVTLGLAACAAAWPLAQQPTTPDAQPTFRLRTVAVVVDVVVRGDGRRPVAGLSADDFEVREDGALQQITSLTAKQTQAVRVASTDEIDLLAPVPPDARVTPDDSIGDAGVVAIVFDRLTPETRWLAHRAARQFIGNGPEAPGVIGVFGIGMSLQPVANVTGDYRSIRSAVDVLGQNQALPFGQDQAPILDLQATQLRMMLGFEMAERDFRSNITVAIYTIDAAGLRAVSTLEQPRNTGGAHIESTNDLARVFTRVTEDMANHYVLTYVSTNPAYDRKYRRIQVKVRRPGVSVSARHGYYAIPPASGLVTQAWEAPAVSALEASRLPNAFPVQLERLVFPTADPEVSTVPLILQAEARHFRYDQERDRYRAEAVFLLRIRDINGQVLAKASDWYVLEAAVHDMQADRASVRVGSLDVPRAVPGLPRLGSVFVIQHAQPGVTAWTQLRSPLLHDGVLLYPNVSRTLSREQAKDVTFAFSVLPMGATVGHAEVELAQGSRVVGQAQLALNPPGDGGRIQQIASLPVADLPPGNYDLRVRVPAAGRVLSRGTRFTVTP